MADVAHLRDWAEAVVAQLPPEAEAYGRAESALWVIDYAVDARGVLFDVARYVGDFPPIADRVNELLVRWGREVSG